MKPPVRPFAAAIILPDAPRSVLEALQKTYDLPSWEPRIPPHITLVSPFTTRTTEDELAALWEPVAAGRAPFPIRLEGFGRFDNEESVLFVAVASEPQLTAIANDALGAVQHLRAPLSHQFIPHATLTAPAPRATVDVWMERLSQEILQIEFPCDRFAMLVLHEAEPREWRVIREFPFMPA